MKKLIQIKEVNGCYICVSHKWVNKKGYPRIERNGKTTTMSRYIYEENYGKIPNGLIIRHKCDNPKCIKLEHLETGTPKENTHDSIIRKRICCGINSPYNKLNEKQINYILLSKKGIRELGRELNISHSHISRIKNNKKWKHIQRGESND